MTIKKLLDSVNSISEEHKEMLLSCLLKMSRFDLHNNLNKIVDETVSKLYYEQVLLVQNNYPIQYVIGDVNFYGYIFKVNKNVLIPRFETEELVEKTLFLIKKYFSSNIKIIDLGSGSGAIGLTLKNKLPECNVTLLDISKDALDVSKENAKNLKVDVSFIESDMWENVNDKFDVVISNPPYIKDDEKIEEIVKNNEPHLALYGGKDGLDCYLKIHNNIKKYLNDKFLIALEIGDTLKDDIIKIFSDLDAEIFCEKDLQGRDRMIFILKK